MSSKKSKFVHFADHHGQSLVSELIFNQDAPITCTYDRTVRLTCGQISKTTGTKTSTQFDHNLGLVGI